MKCPEVHISVGENVANIYTEDIIKGVKISNSELNTVSINEIIKAKNMIDNIEEDKWEEEKSTI